MSNLRLSLTGIVGTLICVGSARALPAPVAYYSLNGDTNDSSGNGYNGTVNGTTAYGTGYGQSQAFSFNGSTNIATTTTDNLGLINGSFTVDAEVNFATPAGGDLSVFGTTGSGTDQGLHLIERGDKPFMGFYGDDTGGMTPLVANTWYNIAWVYDSSSGTQSIYVNGQLDTSSTGHHNFQGTGETSYIGASCCGGQMNGLIERVGVYDSALTQSEIQSLVPTPEPAAMTICGVVGFSALLSRRHRRLAI